MKKRIIPVAATLLVLLVFMGMTAGGTRALANTQINYNGALHFLTGTPVTDAVYEGITVELDLDKLAEQNDDLLMAYLEGNIKDVCGTTDVGDSRFTYSFTEAGSGKYRWTVPDGTAGGGNSAFFTVKLENGDFYLSNKHYVLLALPDGDAGSRTIDLKDGAVSLHSFIEVADGRRVADQSSFITTMDAAAGKGMFSALNFKTSSENPNFKTARVDLDRNGSSDIRIDWQQSNETGNIILLSTCSVEGDYTISLSGEDQMKLNLQCLTFHNKLTLRLPPIRNFQDASVTLQTTKYTYNGSERKPKVSVVYNGSELKKGTDYTVSYKNNKNAGTASAVVTGKGLYSGTVTKTFEINKAPNPLKIKGRTASVRYSKLKNESQTLGVTKVISFTEKGKGKMKYTLSSAGKGGESFKKYFRIDSSTGKVTVKKGLEKGTYQVKVKVKAAGNSNYKASAEKTVTFKVTVE